MIELMKKDFFRVAVYVQIPIAMMVLFILAAPQDVLFGSMMRNLMVLVVGLGAVLIIEQNEEKNRGYSFLSSLPVSAGKIVRAKFLLVSLFIIYMVIVNAVVVNIFFANPENIRIAIAILVYCAGLSFIYTGINFAGMMKWGAAKFYTISFVILLVVASGSLLLAKFAAPEEGVLDSLKSLSWEGGLIFLAASLGVYLLTMLISERLLAKKLGQR